MTPSPLLDHAWIAAHIPHQGRMCLLDRVEQWSPTQVRCSASSHRVADHPLRVGERLGAHAGIEYAAQAMAVHGALLAGETATPPRAGYLASVRDLQLQVARLDDVPGALLIDAELLSGDARSALYGFRLSDSRGAGLLSGRAAVIFDALAQVTR